MQWHLLGTHYSYPVAFITSALEEETPQAITGISILCTNSMETLTPNLSLQLATDCINYIVNFQPQWKMFPFNNTTPLPFLQKCCL